MGFKDGTNNVRGEDTEAMEEHVWEQAGDGPPWMDGGTYLVARRIKILLDVWDATSLDAHVRLSSPESGQRILRRGYSFSEPSEPSSGQIDAGLFFISFQRDPLRQFVPIQRRLTESDALNRHIQHTASAVFACPPGVRPGGFVGEGLFA